MEERNVPVRQLVLMVPIFIYTCLEWCSIPMCTSCSTVVAIVGGKLGNERSGPRRTRLGRVDESGSAERFGESPVRGDLRLGRG